MSPARTLQQLFCASARAYASRTALEDASGRTISFQALDALTDRVRDRLRALNVVRGDRVGLCLLKSIDSVASLIGSLKCGAAFVPVDATAPMTRAAFILGDCAVKVVFVERSLAGALEKELAALGATCALVVIDREVTSTLPLERALPASAPTTTELGEPTDLAYVLYTSGSTGKPKGVVLSHDNAMSFVDWCAETLAPTEDDRFSSHAPFHFDLSVLDLYTPWHSGSVLVLIDEKTAKDPKALVRYAAERRISIWYSTPTVLSLMVQTGHMDDQRFAFRTVIFAGEVFPLAHLRRLTRALRGPIRYLNLYGPTETNVCTFYALDGEVPDDRMTPLPIGVACRHYRIRVLREDGTNAPRGEQGELIADGPAVMQGYWHLAERTAAAFHLDADGSRWYRTGDIVFEDEAGQYVYVGRRDRMVKKRGYRVELGEIEACLHGFAGLKEAAVLAGTTPAGDVTVTAFVAAEGARPSIIALKKHCADRLPIYMVPDVFQILDELPHTSTDKIDLQQLRAKL